MHIDEHVPFYHLKFNTKEERTAIFEMWKDISLLTSKNKFCDASLHKQKVAILGDLNLNRLRPNTPDGKLLMDLEEEQEFACLIQQPARVQTTSTNTVESLIDVSFKIHRRKV